MALSTSPDHKWEWVDGLNLSGKLEDSATWHLKNSFESSRPVESHVAAIVSHRTLGNLEIDVVVWTSQS